jgi:hypothetical protein
MKSDRGLRLSAKSLNESDEPSQNPSVYPARFLAQSLSKPNSARESRWRAVSAKKTDRAPFSFRKEVIQPQVLLRLPCYDFTPIMSHTLSACLLAVGTAISSTAHFRDVTGGVYKARERIHGAVLMRHY